MVNYLIIRGSCKTALHGKIDDFEAAETREGPVDLRSAEQVKRPWSRTGGSRAATIHSTRSTPSGSAEENGREWSQKGDFNGQMSFASCLIKKSKLGPLTDSMQVFFF